jgi:hypothetical protein
MKFSKNSLLAVIIIINIFVFITNVSAKTKTPQPVPQPVQIQPPPPEVHQVIESTPENLKQDFIESYGNVFPELKDGFCQPYNFPQVMEVTICQNGNLKAIRFDPLYKITLDKTVNLVKTTLNKFRKSSRISEGDAALLKAIALQESKEYKQSTLNAFIIYMVDHIDPLARNIKYSADDLDKFYAQQEENYKHLADQVKDGDSFLDSMEKLVGEVNVRLMLGIDVLNKNDETLTTQSPSVDKKFPDATNK